MISRIYTIMFSILSCTFILAQKSTQFDQEVEKFAKLSLPDADKRVVFTGSSSIRMWKGLSRDCQGKQLVNTGFGGSQMSDLLYYLEETVLRFKPDEVYIYEGDNDITAGKTPKAVLKTTKKVARRILNSDPEVNIHFLSAKPSPSRWAYRDQYVTFNTLLKKYCDSHPRLFYIDVWNPMLDNKGRPSAAIFTADSLHMNRKGYDIWKDLICNNSN